MPSSAECWTHAQEKLSEARQDKRHSRRLMTPHKLGFCWVRKPQTWNDLFWVRR
jgi:hypothetical protein